MTEVLEIEITGREADLILEYGYPFPEQAIALQKVAGRPGCHVVSIEGFSLEMILADLSRSIRELDDGALVEELDELCTVIEGSIRK